MIGGIGWSILLKGECMALSYKEADRKISDIKYLENYLALYIMILGVIDAPPGTNLEDYTKEELRNMKRKYINSADALKLMGVKIEKETK